MFSLFRSNSASSTSAQPSAGGNGASERQAAAQAGTAPGTAPGTGIRYSPTLIDELKNDHKQLLATYTAIQAAFDKGDYVRVSAKLNEFRIGLQGHLLTENVRFYIYLDRVHGQDEMNADLIRGFRKEMDGIGRAALNFLKKYETIGVDKELAGAFARDFAEIGTVLGERIQREESTLYPLYIPTA